MTDLHDPFASRGAPASRPCGKAGRRHRRYRRQPRPVGRLSSAVRWDWIATNAGEVATKPKQPMSKPNPPNPEEGARVVQAASEQGQAWGMLVWLTKITGARRGEIVSLRWHDVDPATV